MNCGIGVLELLIILMICGFAIISAALTVIALWKICSKAGFNGALSLLMLLPIANIVLLLYIAFAEWPALKNKNE